MAKVTVHNQPKPVTTGGPDNPDRIVCQDKKGRTITVRRIHGIDMYRLSKLLGESSGNAQTLNMALAAAAVCSIDGDAIGFPLTEREIEFTIQRLDFEGIAAAAEALGQLSGDAKAEVLAAKN